MALVIAPLLLEDVHSSLHDHMTVFSFYSLINKSPALLLVERNLKTEHSLSALLLLLIILFYSFFALGNITIPRAESLI